MSEDIAVIVFFTPIGRPDVHVVPVGHPASRGRLPVHHRGSDPRFDSLEPESSRSHLAHARPLASVPHDVRFRRGQAHFRMSYMVGADGAAAALRISVHPDPPGLVRSPVDARVFAQGTNQGCSLGSLKVVVVAQVVDYSKLLSMPSRAGILILLLERVQVLNSFKLLS